MVNINVEAFKEDGFSYEEIESIKRGLKDIKDGKVIPYDIVKTNSREKIFSKQKNYV